MPSRVHHRHWKEPCVHGINVNHICIVTALLVISQEGLCCCKSIENMAPSCFTAAFVCVAVNNPWHWHYEWQMLYIRHLLLRQLLRQHLVDLSSASHVVSKNHSAAAFCSQTTSNASPKKNKAAPQPVRGKDVTLGELCAQIRVCGCQGIALCPLCAHPP